MIFGDQKFNFYSCNSEQKDTKQEASKITKFSKAETVSLDLFEGANGDLIFIEENLKMSPLEISKNRNIVRFNLSLAPEKLESVHYYYEERVNKLFCVANTSEALHSLVINIGNLEIENHFFEPSGPKTDIIYIGCFYINEELVVIDSSCNILS